MGEQLFDSVIKNETGIVFGQQGTDFLGVALERAGSEDRKVAVLSALNVATVKPFENRIHGVRKIDNHASFEAFMVKARSAAGLPEAVVFHGIEEYARLCMIELVGSTATPTQAQWGDMGRVISNDLRELGAVFPVVYVTCDVVSDEEAPTKLKLNLNPNSRDIILGGLLHKVYVGKRRDESGLVTVVQDEPVAALAFQLPRREQAPPVEGSAPKGRGFGKK